MLDVTRSIPTMAKTFALVFILGSSTATHVEHGRNIYVNGITYYAGGVFVARLSGLTPHSGFIEPTAISYS